jgi:signal peptidase
MSAILAGPEVSGDKVPIQPTRLRKMKKSLPRRVLDWVTTLVVAVAVLGVGLAAYAWQVDGLRYMPVLTGSMSPGMPQGSLAVTRPIAPADIREGQVVAFMPPKQWAPADGNPVVHRVAKLDHWVGDVIAMTTKGDNNDGPDPWEINLTDGAGTYAEVIKVIPQAGTVARIVHNIGVPGMVAVVVGMMLSAYGLKESARWLRFYLDRRARKQQSPTMG